MCSADLEGEISKSARAAPGPSRGWLSGPGRVWLCWGILGAGGRRVSFAPKLFTKATFGAFLANPARGLGSSCVVGSTTLFHGCEVALQGLVVLLCPCRGAILPGRGVPGGRESSTLNEDLDGPASAVIAIRTSVDPRGPASEASRNEVESPLPLLSLQTTELHTGGRHCI